MAHEHDQMAGIVDVVARPGAQAEAEARRANTKIQRLHHHAFFTRDMPATVRFYEDILELKLVLSLLDEGDINPESPTPLLHIFFELADGSCMAFFEVVPIHGAGNYPNLTIFDHHISLKIADRATMDYYKARLEAAGYKTFEMNHGFCQSLYVNDPNGLNLEFSYDTEEYHDHFHRAEQVSHEQFRTWLRNRERDRAAAAAKSQ